MRLVPSFFDSFEATTDQLTAVEAHGELFKLVRNERNRAARIPALLDEMDRQVPGFTIVLYEIENMLDPKGNSFWKLELKQRRQGKRTVPAAISEDIMIRYVLRIEELSKANSPSPVKIATGELAKEYGVPDTTIREIVRRAVNKKPKRRRRVSS